MNADTMALLYAADFTLDQIVEIARILEATGTTDRMPRSAQAKPCGPLERWGYDGPQTPRLPDREWWPLRNEIIISADWTCTYCGERHSNMCADHVVPLSRGGTNDPDNLVCCCLPCNSSKKDKLLSEWKGRYQ